MGLVHFAVPFRRLFAGDLAEQLVDRVARHLQDRRRDGRGLWLQQLGEFEIVDPNGGEFARHSHALFADGEQQAAEMAGQLAEVQSRITNARAAFRSQADEDLAKSRGDLAALDENIKSAQDRVRRTELKAPVYGIINKLNVTTVGAVVQPGANVMDIVPLDDSLLVEGRIRPQDIAFIRPGQDAVVKISAYDSSVYGSLKGKVERISADTIIDEKERMPEKQETFYRVMVHTEKNHLGTEKKPLPIIPGMVTTVEILTGEKSVLDYLVKPARTLRDEALRER